MGLGLYELFVTIEKRSGHQLYAKCPLHPDTNASFTINEDTHEWFCHGCARGGAEPEFIAAYYGVSSDLARFAVATWEKKGKLPFPTEIYIDGCCAQLQLRPKEIQVLHSFGITDAIIEQYKLGWDDCRITIPITSQTGQYINVRKYLPPHRRLAGSNNAKVLNVRGLGENHFFPYDAFDTDKYGREVYIVEGEKDCLAARSQGINAVTGLAGTSVPLQEISLFRDKVVYLMLDTDAPGRKLSKMYETALQSVASEIYTIRLPVKDYVEFYQQCPGQDILGYMMESEEIRKLDEPAEKTLLSKSEGTEKLNNWIILDSMSVIGTDPKTYTIPIKLKPVCRDAQCSKPCPAQGGAIPIEIDVDPRQMLQFMDSPDYVQDEYLRKIFGCKQIIAEPVEYVNAQKLLFQESAAFMEGMDSSSFEHRFGIFLYEEDRLMPTQKYTFEACRVTNPRTQQNFYVIRDAKPIEQAHTLEVAEFVDYFKSIDAASNGMDELLWNHYKQWMSLLDIEGRPDLFGAIMLTYLSVTEIQWKSGRLKGWLDSIVMGDTRTGKSQMAQRVVKRLGMGSYINGENARATGVIGGVQKMGDSWVISWGAIPMNDRGLLIIDEASGLTVEDIKDLSATRSSGAVTINKIVKGEARARTRLLWMSNPRSGRNLEDFYWQGFGAFTEFIPVAEDQARFDLVITAAREDVQQLSGIPDSYGTPDLDKWRNLINFAWQIAAENILIGKTIESEVATAAKRLDEKYGGGPLVLGVAVHEKLIRLTCAFAMLTGSIAGDKLVVQPRHVQYAYDFLVKSYDKPTLDYKGYITEYKRAQRARVENTKFVKGLVGMYPALKILLASNAFRSGQVRDILGTDPQEASKIISNLLQRGLLKVTGSGAYCPDKLLIEITKQMEV